MKGEEVFVLIIMIITLGACQPKVDAAGQRTAGEGLYAQQCAACHEVEQGIGPRLTSSVLASYDTPRTLFNYLRLAMPTQTPGSLGEEEYWAITAYLLDERGLLSMEQPLSTESSAGLTLKKE